MLTIPTLLTLFRVALVPVLVLLWFVQANWASLVCSVVFVGASITDWLDGYLARKVRWRTGGCVLGEGVMCWKTAWMDINAMCWCLRIYWDSCCRAIVPAG